MKSRQNAEKDMKSRQNTKVGKPATLRNKLRPPPGSVVGG
jgi:hypothetical protein